MILFGYERRESAIERYSELPLSTPLVHAVARLSLKKMAFHVVVALIGTVALLNASEKMSGFNAGVIYLLFSLGSFYVFFGLVAIYAVYKTRGFALRDVASNYDYNKDSDRRTFWIMHRELFPPDWR